MPRRALLWLAGLALIAGALLLTDRLLWQPGLTEDSVRRIPPGMTLAEVEALLGGPAADSFEMPADYLTFRWQREWREGNADVVVQVTVHRPKGTAVHSGRSCFNVQTDQPIPGPASLS